MIRECAPGKIILFGEHAVVYGRPALAAPVHGLQACAKISPLPGATSCRIRLRAPVLQLNEYSDSLPEDHPLARVCSLTMEELKISAFESFNISIESTIPASAGLGSGAAVSVAIIRAITRFFNACLDTTRINALAFEIEKIHHGTPSGIDNSVISYAKPILFRRGAKLESFSVRQPFTLLIADTGVKASTSAAVSKVRIAWECDPQEFDNIFDRIALITMKAQHALAEGNLTVLGSLMTDNQALLSEMGVSAPSNELLIQAAAEAGALGAKLSGGGLGGNIIVLPPQDQVQVIHDTLIQAGAAACYQTEVS